MLATAFALERVVDAQHELSKDQEKLSSLSDKFHDLESKMIGFDQQIAEVKRDAAQAHEDVVNVSIAIEQFTQSEHNFIHEMNTMNASVYEAVSKAQGVSQQMERSVTDQIEQMKHWVEGQFQQTLVTMREELDGVVNNLTRVQKFSACVSSLQPAAVPRMVPTCT